MDKNLALPMGWLVQSRLGIVESSGSEAGPNVHGENTGVITQDGWFMSVLKVSFKPKLTRSIPMEYDKEGRYKRAISAYLLRTIRCRKRKPLPAMKPITLRKTRTKEGLQNWLVGIIPAGPFFKTLLMP